MSALKILTTLLLLALGNGLQASSCDSTVWYQSFDLLQVQGVNRLDTGVRPSSFPFAEVCFEGGYPQSIYVYLGNGVVLGGRYGFTASKVNMHRDSLGRDAYLHLDLYPGDSIISLQFIKKCKPGGHRWMLQYKKVTYETESIWIGPSLDRNIQSYNVRRLMAHPQKLSCIIPDTLGNEYYATVRRFVDLPTRGYAVETYAYNMERDAQRPANRQRIVFTRRACYELGEGVDGAKLGPWLLEGVREDSVKCNK